MPTFKDVPARELRREYDFHNEKHADLVDAAANRWARNHGFISGWWDGEIGPGEGDSKPFGVYCVTDAEAWLEDTIGDWGTGINETAVSKGALCGFWNGEQLVDGDGKLHLGTIHIRKGIGQLQYIPVGGDGVSDYGVRDGGNPHRVTRARRYRLKQDVHRWAGKPRGGDPPFQSGVPLVRGPSYWLAWCF